MLRYTKSSKIKEKNFKSTEIKTVTDSFTFSFNYCFLTIQLLVFISNYITMSNLYITSHFHDILYKPTQTNCSISLEEQKAWLLQSNEELLGSQLALLTGKSPSHLEGTELMVILVTEFVNLIKMGTDTKTTQPLLKVNKPLDYRPMWKEVQ